MMNKLYLITLMGQGDISYALVDKETWDYILASCPEFPKDNNFIEESPPDSVKQNIFDPNSVSISNPDSPKRWEDVTLGVSSGSYKNDRALGICCGHKNQFDSNRGVRNFCKEHNVEIVDEYEGYIY